MIDVAILGAGLAGLSCAVRLEAAGLSVLILEANDAPGGRVRTDEQNDFRLDRGFQILLTGYPDADQQLDMKMLRLRQFAPGALVRRGGKFHRFADPFRDSMGAALGLLFDPIVSFGDKLRIARLRAHVNRGSIPELFTREETTTRQFLRGFGFSERMVARFFEPFLGGIFLERDLVTSSRYFQFLFRMFAFGSAAVPERGMEMIPRQLAVRLKADTLLTQTAATHLRREREGIVVETMQQGTAVGSVHARRMVLALPEPQARTLLGTLGGHGKQLGHEPRVWNRTTTFYYAAHRSPVEGPILVLNGDGPDAGPVNHVAVMSEVSRAYAPPGAHLVAVSVVGQAPEGIAAMEKLERNVRTQLHRWFGAAATRWEILGGYPIAHALPLCPHVEWQRCFPRVTDGIYVCGDYREQPSIQGALASGRRAAEAILAQVR
ncbi:MAG: protoporphyrinogen/coproporphyrinogen oxidase [Acidobacteriaceae bacterium]